jgi:hypothetical protein
MKWLTVVFKYFPLALQGVVAVEAALKGVPGATKKQIILNAVQAGAAVSEKAPTASVAQIGALIDNVVTTLNESGVFTKSAPTTPVK